MLPCSWPSETPRLQVYYDDTPLSVSLRAPVSVVLTVRVDSRLESPVHWRAQQLHTQREDGDQYGCRVAQRAGGRCEPGATSSQNSPLSGRREPRAVAPPRSARRSQVAEDGVARERAPRVDAL